MHDTRTRRNGPRGVRFLLPMVAIAGSMAVGASPTFARSLDAVGACVTPSARSAGVTSPARYVPSDLSEARLVGAEATGTANALVVGGFINVYVHVIRSGGVGDVSDSMIATQIAVLNDAFAPSGFGFTLVSTDRTDNLSWFTQVTDGSKAEMQMKNSLRKGTADDLNLYTTNLPGGRLGWGSVPWAYTQYPKDDGVVVGFGTLPGGATGPYNLGDTAVREVGSWLGLLYTFQGGCSDRKGDLVADTPAEKTPGYDCTEGRDTCHLPGSDPIHNFMDFSTDACRDHFTAGQVDRMNQMFTQYRAGK